MGTAKIPFEGEDAASGMKELWTPFAFELPLRADDDHLCRGISVARGADNPGDAQSGVAPGAVGADHHLAGVAGSLRLICDHAQAHAFGATWSHWASRPGNAILTLRPSFALGPLRLRILADALLVLFEALLETRHLRTLTVERRELTGLLAGIRRRAGLLAARRRRDGGSQ